MQIVINIPDEQIKKSLEESKYIHEDEGEKGFVNIVMLYTNAQLEFVDVERKKDFYSCEYNILPEGHGRLIDESDLIPDSDYEDGMFYAVSVGAINGAPTIIEALESPFGSGEWCDGVDDCLEIIDKAKAVLKEESEE